MDRRTFGAVNRAAQIVPNPATSRAAAFLRNS
jgi:hypothetical protein